MKIPIIVGVVFVGGMMPVMTIGIHGCLERRERLAEFRQKMAIYEEQEKQSRIEMCHSLADWKEIMRIKYPANDRSVPTMDAICKRVGVNLGE